MFDPYHLWLGISWKQQPANHYRLLGIELYESNPRVIDSAAERQLEYVSQHVNGPQAKHAQQLLAELETAKRCLLDPQAKQQYDQQLPDDPPQAAPPGEVQTGSGFDPYHDWLGIPPSQQPPTHYRLLGVDAEESSRPVIHEAAERQMAHVRRKTIGRHAALSQQLLGELATARICLLDPAKRRAYDQQLQETPVSKPPQPHAKTQTQAKTPPPSQATIARSPEKQPKPAGTPRARPLPRGAALPSATPATPTTPVVVTTKAFPVAKTGRTANAAAGASSRRVQQRLLIVLGLVAAAAFAGCLVIAAVVVAFIANRSALTNDVALSNHEVTTPEPGRPDLEAEDEASTPPDAEVPPIKTPPAKTPPPVNPPQPQPKPKPKPKPTGRPGVNLATPRIGPAPQALAVAGDRVSFQVPVLHPGKGPRRLTFTLLKGPQGAKVDIHTGRVTWRAGPQDIGVERSFLVRVDRGDTAQYQAEETYVVEVDWQGSTLAASSPSAGQQVVTTMPKIGTDIQRFKTPTPCKTIAFSPDSRHLAGGGFGVVHFIDTETEIEFKFEADFTQVVGCVFGDSTREVILCTGDGKHPKDVDSDRLWFLKFENNPSDFAKANKDVSLNVRMNGHLKVERIAVAVGENAGFHDFTRLPKPGRHFVFTGTFDGPAVLNWETGEMTRAPGPSNVRCVAVKPDGSEIVVGDAKGSLYRYHPDDLARCRTLEKHTGNVHSLTYSPDGETLYSVGKNIYIWSLADGKLKQRIDAFPIELTSLAASNDGKLLVACGNNPGKGHALIAYNAATGAPIQDLSGELNNVGTLHQVIISPDSKKIAVLGSHGFVTVFSITPN